MDKFNTLYNQTILEHSQIICEGFINDFLSKIKNKLSSKFLSTILKNRILSTLKTQKLTNQQVEKLKQLQKDTEQYQKVVKTQVLPTIKLHKSIEEKYIEQALESIDNYLLQQLGSWWRPHLLNQNRIKKLAKKASLQGSSYPLTLSDFNEDVG